MGERVPADRTYNPYAAHLRDWIRDHGGHEAVFDMLEAALTHAGGVPAAAGIDVQDLRADPANLELVVHFRDGDSYDRAYRLLVGHDPITSARLSAGSATEDETP